MTTIIPGPGEDGYAMRDEESAAEALGYRPIRRERSDEDDERAYVEEHRHGPYSMATRCREGVPVHTFIEETCAELAAPPADAAPSPVITNDESNALHLGARALAEVAAGLERSGQPDLAAESARSAAALDDLQRRSTVAPAREQATELEAER